MKKLLLATALVAASAGSANAYVGINLDFFDPAPVYAAPVYAPPAYVQPAPVYVQPAPVYYSQPGYYSGRWRHRNYDWGYWNQHPAPRGPVRGGPIHGGPGFHH